MRNTRRTVVAVLALTMIAIGCGDDATDSPTTLAGATTTTAPGTTTTVATTTTAATATTAATTTTAAATTTSATTTTAATTTTEPPDPAITIDGTTVTINPDALVPPFFAAPASGSSDPYWHFHTTPAQDGFFLAVEAYTTGYGVASTGELGTYPIECTTAGTGICVHFDQDGPGPAGDVGADFLATGSITFDLLEPGSYDITLENLAFTDGTTIPGPLRFVSG